MCCSCAGCKLAVSKVLMVLLNFVDLAIGLALLYFAMWVHRGRTGHHAAPVSAHLAERYWCIQLKCGRRQWF